MTTFDEAVRMAAEAIAVTPYGEEAERLAATIREHVGPVIEAKDAEIAELKAELVAKRGAQ